MMLILLKVTKNFFAEPKIVNKISRLFCKYNHGNDINEHRAQ